MDFEDMKNIFLNWVRIMPPLWIGREPSYILQISLRILG